MRQLPELAVPRVCVLDPDGDLVRHVSSQPDGARHRGWACYHTEMWLTELADQTVGVVGCAVGGPFAVLVAEQLASSGCELVVSVSSAGLVGTKSLSAEFVLIERALRDEGTSHHYLPPTPWSLLDRTLLQALEPSDGTEQLPWTLGSSWTTDAPFRETAEALANAAALGIDVVEMEAASLYAYGAAQHHSVVCLAQVTNQMGTVTEDFDKGPGDGVTSALLAIARIVEMTAPIVKP